MIKKVKDFLQKRKTKKTQLKELQKMKDFYAKLQAGALFIEYIHKDIEKNKKEMNRAQRRRYEVHLKENGKFSSEMVEHYKNHIDKIAIYINKELADKIK